MSFWRVGACVLAGMMQLACADGYPNDEDGLMLSYGMTLAESVEAMNQIGQSRSLERRWRYALRTDCVLVVGAGQPLTKHKGIALPLADTTSAMAKGEDGLNYRVSLRTAANGPAEGVVVLEHASWSDATQMRWLLDHVRAHCVRSGVRS